MLRIVLTGTLLGLAGCMTAEQPAAGGAQTGMQPAPDTCNAGRYRNLLGRPYTEAPPAGSMANYRLIAQGDPVTMDYSEGRLNIIYDRDSGRIIGVRCF